MGHALSLGVDHAFEIAAPFAHLDKPDVIRIGAALDVPWELTLSCMNPAGVEHCGRCSKCRERLQAFDRPAFQTRRRTPGGRRTWQPASRSPWQKPRCIRPAMHPA